jgi:cytochrome P450
MNEQVQAAATEPLFNPLSPDFIRDPYPHYERLRSSDPMHLTAFGAYVASRHAEVSLVMRDKRFGKDYVERTKRRYGPQIMEEPVFRSMSHWMLQQDPPDHTRLRGLVVKAFTARRVEDMRPRIQEIVDQTLDRIAPQGHMDLIEDFAFRLPVTIICDMLGIPEEHREVFYTSSRNGGRLLDPVPLSKAEIEQGNASNLMQQMYFQQLFELRRKNPGDDLTTQLVQAEEDGNKLSNEELIANIILLFGAGHETTVNLIGNGLLALHRNPDQLALLQTHPELITNAVEEFLRYDSSVQLTGGWRWRTSTTSQAGKSRKARACCACWVRPTGIRRSIPTARTGSTSPVPKSARCPLAGASTFASAPSWHGSRPRSRFRRCCAGCRGSSSTIPKIRNGSPPSCCAA